MLENINERHQEMVAGLAKPGAEIAMQLTPTNAHAWHMATGVAGEAGEVLDLVKKVVAYNKPLDREHLVEELGDVEFYLEGLRQAFNISREEVLQANYEKLGKRYNGHKYSDDQARNRADKNT